MSAPVGSREERALTRVGSELLRAQSRFAPFQSAHEGLAVILEEYREFEHEVFHGSGDAAYDEAVQLAAMAVRYMLDIGRRARIAALEKETGIGNH